MLCVVSGSGKIAMHVLEKLLAFGAIPVTVSEIIQRLMLVLNTMTKQNLGVKGSNMPCTPEAVDVLRKANVLIAPAIAAGAGGVAAGELELSNWSPEEFESKLQTPLVHKTTIGLN
ncbi:unnamed protein product [Thlaspi arvense]|uniref:Glutamate/phenylalanine/leucine/valine/L-tryptophan dehydrogenase C-terminal domain-containing protein n=1 Tax=Thlaspi arvense TaxID=13288 RepID=A0AAU9SXC3_THLAR|nr:unnamed protein product [Thlaspi arvense]